MRTLLIIPAYNEEQTLCRLIEDIRTCMPSADYLVINDCSNDNTKQVLSEINASFVNCSINLGIGGAVQTGYIYAYENGYDIAIQLDGDGQHDVRFISNMVSLIENDEADVVIGSRFIDKEGFQSSVSRRMGISFLSGLIRLMCGVRIKDVTSGFRAVNRPLIELFATEYPDDYPEPEVIVASYMHGARIEEIPVIMRDRQAGHSSINLKKSIYYMIKVSIAIILCRISLGSRQK